MERLKRAIIIAKGKVQKVGYRDFVQDSARELGIVGCVENLEDGNVKVLCEGKESEINDFIKSITVKRGFIDVVETSVEYEEPTGEFNLFRIIYGGVAEELGDRLGAALLYLGATNQKIDAGFKMLGEKQDDTIEILKSVKEDTSMMLEKQDLMLGKQDDTIEILKSVKEDTSMMLDKQDLMLDKQDQMLGKQDDTIEAINRSKEEIVTEIGSLREDLKSYMENKFAIIERDIEVIKGKIGMV